MPTLSAHCRVKNDEKQMPSPHFLFRPRPFRRMFALLGRGFAGAAHNNFSDSALFAPGIMRKLKSAGKMDGVTFIDQVRQSPTFTWWARLGMRRGKGW